MKWMRHLVLIAGIALSGCGDGEEDEGCTDEQVEAAQARCERCLDSCSNCDDPLAACVASCRSCEE